ncbi:hypothetical protein GQR58_023695 [Nymphon striatum]|nr:hypothetical protein GQR58_023695 [Nymphon striatum]
MSSAKSQTECKPGVEGPSPDHPLLRNKRQTTKGVKCVPGPFYRHPDLQSKDRLDCSRYYLCIGGAVVYEYKCTTGLQFDIIKQNCNFISLVKNCNVQEHIANDPNAAKKCDLSKCKLPNCYCSKDGTKIPKNMDVKTVPQIIVLTFDDAVNFQNWNLYKEIFDANRTNPNGCPIRGTFFLSHEYTNYQYTQKLWNKGHEIAVHSITHRTPELWWSGNATLEDWFDEFAGQANIINKFGNIRMEDLRGIRVPFLRVGWNKQFLMMKDFGFIYDSTMVAPFQNPPLWPYTLDYRMPHKCVGASNNCPSQAFPGIWELPMNQLELEKDGVSCAMVDSCNIPGEETYDFFMNNFFRHYETNRAPLGLYFHTTWFQNYDNMEGFLQFLDEMAERDDVWFITNYQLIQWMKNPTPLSKIERFAEWGCNDKRYKGEEKACETPNVCILSNKETFGEHYFHTCATCPAYYPWIRNEFGLEDPSKFQEQYEEELDPAVQKKKK